MKLGVLTILYNERPLEEVARQEADLGYEAVELPAWCDSNHLYRAYPLVQLARTMIRSGELGRPHLIHGSYLQDWLLYQSDYNWRLNSAVGGKSRAMADIGSHWCDLIEYVTGDRIHQLCAQYKRIYDVRTGGGDSGETFAATQGAQPIPVDTEDIALTQMRFASGAVGSTIISQVSAGRKNRLLFEIDCAEGSVEWNQEHPEHLWIGRRGRPNEEIVRDPAILPEAIRSSTVYPAGHPEGWPDALTAMLPAVYADIGKPAQARQPWYATFAVLWCASGVSLLRYFGTDLR